MSVLKRYNGTLWEELGGTSSGTSILQQDSEPGSPTAGDLWLDTDEVAQSGTSVWTQVFNIVGTEAMTGWTAMSGVWAPNGAGYWEITTLASPGVLRYTSRINMTAMILEAEVWNPSGGSGSTRIGISQRNESDYNYQPLVYTSLPAGTNTSGAGIATAYNAVQEFGNTPGTAFDTWTKLRGVFIGPKVTAYVDGVCRGSAYAGADYRGAHSFCLWAQDGKARYRNIKLWTMTGGIPA